MLLRVIDLQRPVRWGMTGYVGASFRVRSFGLQQLQLSASTILAPNHRSDNDVPLLVSTLGPRWAEMVAAGLPWATFAADDHAFLHGFLAGYGGRLPLTVRRLLWPIRVGGIPERQWIACALAQGRPIEPDLLGARRRPVLAQAFARARRRGAGDAPIRALAQELQNANEAS